jgi:hypothetical protein
MRKVTQGPRLKADQGEGFEVARRHADDKPAHASKKRPLQMVSEATEIRLLLQGLARMQPFECGNQEVDEITMNERATSLIVDLT